MNTLSSKPVNTRTKRTQFEQDVDEQLAKVYESLADAVEKAYMFDDAWAEQLRQARIRLAQALNSRPR